ncbi:hypothetical protein ELQ35_07580 [Peribacillus cavernae]|uniref:SGNH hydrolase-type esterase domain-containing protein n=1 Tax=Peribacillus cavernae TaxID=1674310 RepID=A0A433HPG9_9BACI|nr:GDSL-type esterase/lipase family protein [Peribacillus cavernae]MDQ0217349.1 lysophospholipase L1-like esterase [Peribacillus cavernae]RUQ30198.1 hypothetical protein ELQ35_07580 [Peribacillus cavernae]
MKKLSIGLITFIITSLIWFSFYTKSKSDDPVIMAFGDSLTYGYGDTQGEGYVDGVEEELNNSGSSKRFRIWNYGIIGQETDGVLEQLDDIRIKSKLDEADYFILFIGTNDLINSNGGDLQPLNEKKINDAKPEYKQHITKILSILKKENKEAPIIVLGLYNPYQNQKHIEKQIDEWDQTIIKTVRNDRRITYIPTNDLFKNKKKQKYFSDSLHPNEQGYQLITSRILDRYQFKR